MHYQTVGYLERGEYSPSLYLALRLAAYFEVPVEVPGVEQSILDPRGTWSDPAEYDRMAAKLVDLFVENFAQFADQVEEGVRRAAPKASQRQQAQATSTKATAA